MKNDDHPMIMALKKKSSKEEPSIHSFEPPRTFELKHSDIPGLPGRKVGEQISVRLQGHIRSQHDTGTAVMHVSGVKPDSEEMESKQYPDSEKKEKTLNVRTQESHV